MFINADASVRPRSAWGIEYEKKIYFKFKFSERYTQQARLGFLSPRSFLSLYHLPWVVFLDPCVPVRLGKSPSLFKCTDV